jgi:hypothetical protein
MRIFTSWRSSSSYGFTAIQDNLTVLPLSYGKAHIDAFGFEPNRGFPPRLNVSIFSDSLDNLCGQGKVSGRIHALIKV